MLLEVENIKLYLESTEILSDVTLKVSTGEMVALLGPNGSGKTTLLRAIYGVLAPDKGAVYLDGKNTNQLKLEHVAKDLGYLPQEKADTFLKVMDVVLLGRTPYGRKPAKNDFEIAERCLKQVGIESLKDRLYSNLSGGEKQKVLLARIFTQQASTLLLDEPTAHLDISSQIEIMEILRERTLEDFSALIAVHDINLATTFCDRILMVKDGKIAYSGGPEVVTPQSIKDVFGAHVKVREQAGRPFVIPTAAPQLESNGKYVHVICGGGSGKDVIDILYLAGYQVSAGVLNALDSDLEAVVDVGDVVSEAPFSPISKGSHQKNMELIDASDAVVLANLCIGSGNLLNLEAAKKAAEQGKLIVINSTPFEERDYCGKEAGALFREICDNAVIVKSEQNLLKAVEELVGFSGD
ncbi:MAG: ABC transporter ATP-binding protein [Archaeoglobaceae archaeon]